MNASFRTLFVASALVGASLSLCGNARAQFVDRFEGGEVRCDPRGIDGWAYFTGDGNAVASLRGTPNGAAVSVDATADRLGIWWALIKRMVSRHLDLRQLSDPHYGIRIESRIRVSDAPKRVNMSLNTQRTTDFHANLMEYDIPDTVSWRTLSLTIRHFDAKPGDTIYGQLALMDWGLGNYKVELQYFKVDVVKLDSVPPDEGVAVPYQPALVPVSSFSRHVPAKEAAMVDLQFPSLAPGRWSESGREDGPQVLTVDGTHYGILRWDLSAYDRERIDRAGELELTTCALFRSPDSSKDFGMIRVCEILGGDPDWTSASVTWNSLCGTSLPDDVINSQMIIDVSVAPGRGGKTLITISQPVMRRLLEGKTLGLALKPLGAVSATFYAGRTPTGELSPILHFSSGGVDD